MIGLTALGAEQDSGHLLKDGLIVLGKGVALLAGVALLMRFILPKLLPAMARTQELLVLFSIAWAVLFAAGGDMLGFSKEVGAFLAGVSLASTHFREMIAVRLTSLRDFLLLFFFIGLGAQLDLSLLGAQIFPALIFSVFVLVGNPIIVMIIMGYRPSAHSLTHFSQHLEMLDLNGVNWQPLVNSGKPFVEIIKTSRDIGADLILIGAHGSDFFEELFVGTTAERVARKSELPVLIVKQPPSTPLCRRILVPTDFSTAATEAALYAQVIAPEAKFDYVHIYSLWGDGKLTPTTAMDEQHQLMHDNIRAKAENQMREWLDAGVGRDHNYRYHLRPGRPGTIIPKLAEELNNDLIIMSTRGQSSLAYALLGNVTEHTLKQSRCDLLTLRPTNFHFELI
ncbi:universal stress protein [Pelobacter sp. M08fum]|uniref:Universal stress protein n=2 Tax=Pelovirga terrestris TaxID=2771352 RepID=A0A8J6QWP6_9BACT|nr:universal stress protein [Pelovirga terrestris]